MSRVVMTPVCTNGTQALGQAAPLAPVQVSLTSARTNDCKKNTPITKASKNCRRARQWAEVRCFIHACLSKYERLRRYDKITRHSPKKGPNYPVFDPQFPAASFQFKFRLTSQH